MAQRKMIQLDYAKREESDGAHTGYSSFQISISSSEFLASSESAR